MMSILQLLGALTLYVIGAAVLARVWFFLSDKLDAAKAAAAAIDAETVEQHADRAIEIVREWGQLDELQLRRYQKDRQS